MGKTWGKADEHSLEHRVVPDIRPILVFGIRPDIRFHFPDIRKQLTQNCTYCKQWNLKNWKNWKKRRRIKSKKIQFFIFKSKLFLARYPVSGRLIGRISGIQQTLARYPAAWYSAKFVSGTILLKYCCCRCCYCRRRVLAVSCIVYNMSVTYTKWFIYIVRLGFVLLDLYCLLQAQIHCTTGYDTVLQVQTL